MKSLFIAFLIMLLFFPAVYCQNHFYKKRQHITADQILCMIDNLPEFKKADAYYSKKTKGKHLLTMLVNGKGNEDGHYYYVTVDEDNGMAYVTWYNFMIDNKTFKIYYMETLTGKYIPLAVWRRQKDYLGF